MYEYIICVVKSTNDIQTSCIYFEVKFCYLQFLKLIKVSLLYDMVTLQITLAPPLIAGVKWGEKNY